MHGHIRNLCIAAALTVASSGLVLGACGSDDAPSQAGPTPTGSGGSSSTASGGAGEGSGICLLNNCTEDAHCDGCADGRTTCLEAENRCVACDPNTGEGCADGEECSSFGLCVPSGLTCPTDNEGNPEVVCEKNSDCAACSPMHQVCDTTTNKCQACTTTNTQHCLESDMCLDGKCSPKCPASCDADKEPPGYVEEKLRIRTATHMCPTAHRIPSRLHHTGGEEFASTRPSRNFLWKAKKESQGYAGENVCVCSILWRRMKGEGGS